MRHFPAISGKARTPRRPASDLERLFGVARMASGRRVSLRPGMGLFAHDIPVREQVWIGLKFAALGLVPPLAFALVWLALVWRQLPDGGW